MVAVSLTMHSHFSLWIVNRLNLISNLPQTNTTNTWSRHKQKDMLVSYWNYLPTLPTPWPPTITPKKKKIIMSGSLWTLVSRYVILRMTTKLADRNACRLILIKHMPSRAKIQSLSFSPKTQKSSFWYVGERFESYIQWKKLKRNGKHSFNLSQIGYLSLFRLSIFIKYDRLNYTNTIVTWKKK